eukprot:jgi/Galph1/1481/GphlegSOOS_G177.1
MHVVREMESLLSRQLTTAEQIQVIKAIKNSCVGHPAQKQEYVEKNLIPVLLKLVDRKDAELTVLQTQICGTIGILANKNVSGAEQVVFHGGIATLLSLVSESNEHVATSAARCLLAVVQTVQEPVGIFERELSLFEKAASCFCSLGLSITVRECVSFIISRCLERKVFDTKFDTSRITEICLRGLEECSFDDSPSIIMYLDILHSLTNRRRDIAKRMVDKALVPLLVQQMKRIDIQTRLLACKVYTNLLCYDLIPSSIGEKHIATVMIPLMKKMLSDSDRVIQIEGCFVLERVVSISETVQRQAFDSQMIQSLIDMTKYITLEDEQAATMLLRAVAALSALVEENRRAVVDSKLFTLIISCMDSTNPHLRTAALSALRSLSRSVKNLRSSLAEAGLMESLLRSLQFPDKEVQVQALAAICNLVLYFSPLKTSFLESNGISTLLKLWLSGDKSLQYYSLWAIKNLLFLSESKIKRRIIEEMGMDAIFALFEKGEEYSIQEQGMNLLRNLTCTFSIENESDAATDLIGEYSERLVSCIQDALQAPCTEVVLQALYVICNFSVGSERHKRVICKSQIPNLLLTFLANENYLIRIAALWCIINLLWKETRDIDDFPNLHEYREARIELFTQMGFEEALEMLLTDANVEVRGRAETALNLLRDLSNTRPVEENDIDAASRGILL